MKAIDLLKTFSEERLSGLVVEIRVNNGDYKCVVYSNKEALDEDPILQREMIDWFIDMVDLAARLVVTV